MANKRVSLAKDVPLQGTPTEISLDGTQLTVSSSVLVTAVFDVELVTKGNPTGTFLGVLGGPSIALGSGAIAIAHLSTPGDRVTIAQTWLIQGGTTLELRARVKGDGKYLLHQTNTGYTVVPVT